MTPGTPASVSEPVRAAEQPPEWAEGLVRLVTHPPEWLAPSLYLVAALVVLSVAYRLHTRDMTKAAREGVIANACMLGCCATATWASVKLLAVPFLADVVVGFGVGAALARVVTPWVTEEIETAVQNTNSAP